ncbi:hypothetical protein EYR41_000629 [Orbilia oligospora]|uniref:Uncharacterized protein n=1 Tax=Orbilia oligospora TaxID=2813651 RepID=A0A7C8KDB4_ORBOL|nr:hypothetical protein TWF751_005792 [Orbilia oligospora]KAF3283937.1 hypothetical protein TWF132_009947 [Orbilia oligospora]TGJ73541.1 hypothetical protein EYR41_000629 [Orbilia oligospora]
MLLSVLFFFMIILGLSGGKRNPRQGRKKTGANTLRRNGTQYQIPLTNGTTQQTDIRPSLSQKSPLLNPNPKISPTYLVPTYVSILPVPIFILFLSLFSYVPFYVNYFY